MAKQTIALGTAPTGVGGDTPRSAFGKVQANFDELYTALGGGASPAFIRANILGPVSQSGGIPTGAIIETITNANGTAIKFANGTMFCLWQTSGFTLNASGYGNFGPYTLPAAFINSTTVVAAGCALPNTTYDFFGITAINVTSTNTFVIVLRNGATAQSASASLLFIGRWF